MLVDDTAPIPRLEEILLTWPHARLNIDTKTDATVMPLITMLRQHRLLDRVCIGSFADRRVKKCRAELGPTLCTSMGQLEAARLIMASKGLADPSLITAPCAQVPRRHLVSFVSPAVVTMAHDLDIQVHVWTINDPDEMSQLLDVGVDGLMTDEPHILRDLLIKRGVWATPGVSR